MEKKFTLNITPLFYLALAMVLLKSYSVVEMSVSLFYYTAILFTLTSVIFLSISCVFFFLGKKRGVYKVNEMPFKEVVSKKTNYLGLFLETGFIVALSFSPKFYDFDFLVWLTVLKWVLMIINAKHLSHLKKRLP